MAFRRIQQNRNIGWEQIPRPEGYIADGVYIRVKVKLPSNETKETMLILSPEMMKREPEDIDDMVRDMFERVYEELQTNNTMRTMCGKITDDPAMRGK